MKVAITTIDLVLSDRRGYCWFRIAVDEWVCNPNDLGLGRSRADLEEEIGPLTVLHSIKIRGEVVA